MRGRLTAAQPTTELPCDLLAVDEAYPAPVADDRTRLRDAPGLAARPGAPGVVPRTGSRWPCPGTSFTADRVLDALSRLAKAVGASADQYAARLRIGGGPAAPLAAERSFRGGRAR